MPTHPGPNGFNLSMTNFHRLLTSFRKIFFFLFLAILVLTACSPNLVEPLPTETPTPDEAHITPTSTPTPRPSPTPTLPPLGSLGNPITIGFILSTDQSNSDPAIALVDLLSTETGYVFDTLLYPDFGSLSTAIVNGDVHLFWLKPLEYVFLNDQGVAEVMLMTNHQGVFAYGIQFLANVNSGFLPSFDADGNPTFDNPIEILQQFSGTRPCYLDPQSIPGYFVPKGLLADASTPTLDPVFVFSYNAIIRALYIRGICDFGVTFAYTGDPLTSSDILANLPDAKDQIRVIWLSDNFIPNINLSASPSLPVFMRFRIEEALIRIADEPHGLNLISSALVYDVEALRSIEDHFYNAFRAILAPLELDLQPIVIPPVEE